MSVEVSIDHLPKEIQAQISKDLKIKPKKERKSFGDDHKEIFMFLKKGNKLYLPYRYYRDLTEDLTPNEFKGKAIVPFKVKYTLLPHQVEIEEICLESYQKRGTVNLNLFCSFGKTRMGVYFASIFSQMGLPTLVVIPPRDKLQIGWETTFQQHTDIKHIHVVGKSSGEMTPETQVIICMKNNLDRIPDEIMSRIGHLLLDEAHMLVSQKSFDELFRVRPTFITCCTATYERQDGMHIALDLIVGPEKITKISKMPFYVVRIDTGCVPEGYTTGSRGIQWGSVQKCYDKMDNRNAAIISICLSNPKEKILILTLHKDHAANVHKWLTEIGENTALLCGTKKFYNDSRILVGTFSKIGVGFDEESACGDWDGIRLNMLVLAASTKQIEQFAGRVFRAKEPVIYHLVDNFRNNKDHYRECRKWYESRGGHIVKRPITSDLVWQNIKSSLTSIPIRQN